MAEAKLGSNSGQKTCEIGFEMSESYILSKNNQVNIPIESEAIDVKHQQNDSSCGLTSTSKTQETHIENSSSFIFLEEKLTFPYEQDISSGDRGYLIICRNWYALIWLYTLILKIVMQDLMKKAWCFYRTRLKMKSMIRYIKTFLNVYRKLDLFNRYI